MTTCNECSNEIDKTTPESEWFSHKFLCSRAETEYVMLGYASGRMQTQYSSLYTGVDNHRHGGNRPNLVVGLRFYGSPTNYHTMMIHREDAAEFERRLTEHYDC